MDWYIILAPDKNGSDRLKMFNAQCVLIFYGEKKNEHYCDFLLRLSALVKS